MEYYKPDINIVNDFYKECIEAVRDLQKKKYRNKFKPFHNYKRTLKCHICGKLFNLSPSICDFHHVDSETKIFGITKMVQLYGFKSEEVRKELKKCISLCANCHRLVHHGDGIELLGRNV